ncbi:MAG: hypothetical protein HKN68_13570 [Saprospiraceae bacterium]|nr:hypothetical protein [Saprospiraceae bacterium]
MLPNNHIAAIDMGTNTFHMLIAYVEGNRLVEIFRLRKWVNLAESGLEQIGNDSLERAWSALKEFKEHISLYKVDAVEAVATEAFRSAHNGMAFLNRVKKELGFEAKIISGDKEAELIYKGISLLRPGEEQKHSLIMDIGGGSTEFILYNQSGKVWSRSYKAGVTYLYNQFVTTDPLSIEEEESLVVYFRDQFSELLEVCSMQPVKELIGASGSFEVVEMMLGIEPSRSKVTCVEINHFNDQFNYLRKSKIQDRIDDPRIPENRARLIVVAYLLMKYIIDHVGLHSICISPYAMKEGIIREADYNLDKSKKII